MTLGHFVSDVGGISESYRNFTIFESRLTQNSTLSIPDAF